MKFDIEKYVEDNLLRVKPVASGNGSELTAVCPSCEKYGGFYINFETGSFLCNKCEFRARTVVGLIAHVEDISWSDARSYIFDRSVKLRRKEDVFSLSDRIRSLRVDAVEDDDDKEVSVELPEHYVHVFDRYRAPQWMIPKYLKERGIKSKVAAAWGLGYCTRGDHGDRLIIPIDCPAGVSWTARAMSDDVWGPKYLNPSGADHRKLLIGWHVARVTGDIVLCEGPFDAVKLYQHDLSALALGGKELHDEQLSQLIDGMSPKAAITVMLDPEEEVASIKLAMRLKTHFEYVYLAKLPMFHKSGEHCDPGNATRKQAHDAVDNATRSAGRADLIRLKLEKSRRWAERY